VWCASTTTNLGDGIRIAVLPLLAVSLTRDTFLVSLVVAAGSLPWLVVGLFAGAMVDRWDRVRILWVVNAVRAAAMLLLVVSILTGWVSIWLLVLVAVVIGAGETFVDNATQAVLPRFVPPGSLERANGRPHRQLISLPSVFWLSAALLATTVAAVGRLEPAPGGGSN